MKKKFIVITMVLCLVFSLFTVTSSAATKKASKYTKVKTTTYQKYKKAYNNQKTLKKKINSLNLKLANKQADYEDAIDQYEIALEENEKLTKELNETKSMNKWLWNNIYSMGISYENKMWTIPAEFPQTFIIDGAKYKVVIETIEEEE